MFLENAKKFGWKLVESDDSKKPPAIFEWSSIRDAIRVHVTDVNEREERELREHKAGS